MTLLYKWNNHIYSLEYFITHFNFQKIWGEILIDEYISWNNISLDDLIIETSEVFEEVMHEKRWYIEFVRTDTNKFDYNILLDALR